jgi:H+-transporting ATPase
MEVAEQTKEEFELQEVASISPIPINSKDEVSINVSKIDVEATDLKMGLLEGEVEKRHVEFGYNEIVEKKRFPLIRFLKKFTGMTAYMLEITAILGFGLQNYTIGVVIIVLLLLNSCVGFYPEMKASKASKEKLQVNARVLRGGKWNVVGARELVPGDVVRIRNGDFVPADVRILETSLEVDQSAITGESKNIHKEPGSDIYSGSIVKSGEAIGIVTSTAANTFFGKTVSLVSSSAPRLHVEDIIQKIIWALVAMVLTMLVIAIIIYIFVQKQNALDILLLLLLLMVTAVPVAFPAVFSVTMAYGSKQLTKKGVLVTRMNVTEDASSMSVLCFDKTGTITKNLLSVVDVKSFSQKSTKEDVLITAFLCSKEENTDAIDLASIAETRKLGIDPSQNYTPVGFVPFDSATRRTEATVKDNQGVITTVTKGAFQSILDLSIVTEEQVQEMKKYISEMASNGHKTIAVARCVEKKEDDKFEFQGLIALSDCPREDSKEVIQTLRDMGIRVLMLTGDALSVATHIGKQVGLGGNIIGLGHSKTDKTEDKAVAMGNFNVEETDGFAEIFPEDKYSIVKVLQSKHYIVGMTGDGVNDAPALKQAQVGIAVSNAIDLAKGSASVVLTTEGLAPTIHLVRVSRMIHERIATWILNKIVKTFLTVVFIVIVFLSDGIFIVKAINILALLFLIDFVTLALATDNTRGSKFPVEWKIFHLLRVAVTLGIVAIGESIGLLYIGFNLLGIRSDIETVHTFTMEILFFSSLCTVYVVRERSWFWRSIPSRLMLSVALVDSIVVIIISTFGIPGLGIHGIPIQFSFIIVGYSIVFSLFVNDFIKVMLYRFLKYKKISK